MFDPDKWVIGEFDDARALAVGQKFVVTMQVPLLVAVAVTGVVIHNQDSVNHDFQITWSPDAMTGNAQFVEETLIGGETAMLLPQMPAPPANAAKFLGPWLLTGSGTLIVEQTTPTVTPNAIVQIDIHWLQAKFAAKSSGLLIPLGVAV